jgi:hypothetical protein
MDQSNNIVRRHIQNMADHRAYRIGSNLTIGSVPFYGAGSMYKGGDRPRCNRYSGVNGTDTSYVTLNTYDPTTKSYIQTEMCKDEYDKMWGFGKNSTYRGGDNFILNGQAWGYTPAKGEKCKQGRNYVKCTQPNGQVYTYR